LIAFDLISGKIKKLSLFLEYRIWSHLSKVFFMAKRKPVKDPDLKRVNPHTIRFNNKEWAAIRKYCSKYKINNRTKFMREAIMRIILDQFEQDYPSLFDQPAVKEAEKQEIY